MNITPITTRPLVPPKDDLFAVIAELRLPIKEHTIVAITAKVVAIHQGRSIRIPEDAAEAAILKDVLIKQNAERYLERDQSAPHPRIFTMYEGTFCSSSGIDESNSNGYWTLLPKDSAAFAHEMRTYLCKKYDVRNLGVIITDSRSYPMRNGTIGITLGYAGFDPLYDYRNTTDIFGRKILSERMNVADCLASTATLAMGEGNESTPLVVMHDVPHVVFSDTQTPTDDWTTLRVNMDDDVFAQFYANKEWKEGG